MVAKLFASLPMLVKYVFNNIHLRIEDFYLWNILWI